QLRETLGNEVIDRDQCEEEADGDAAAPRVVAGTKHPQRQPGEGGLEDDHREPALAAEHSPHGVTANLLEAGWRRWPHVRFDLSTSTFNRHLPQQVADRTRAARFRILVAQVVVFATGGVAPT